MRFEWIAVGNFTKEIVLDLTKKSEEVFTKTLKHKLTVLPVEKVPTIRTLNFEVGKTYLWEGSIQKEEYNSVIISYY